jgi:hypothetical protein
LGLIDRLAKAVADQIEKAPNVNLPAGAVVMSEQDMRNANQNQTYGQQTPLLRNPLMSGVPFGPGQPILPGAINPLRPDGRPDPRRYEYQVAQNLNIGSEQKLVQFKTLRGAAEQIDIARRCIEVLKAKISGMDWDIVISENASEKIIAEIGGDHTRAMSTARENFSEEIYRLRSFWENPDRSNGLTFIDWMMMSLEEILVLDAWAVWPQKTVGGDLYGFQILDGSTIKPMLDDRGMRPMAPQAAYQQILYGFPRTEFQANSDDQDADGEFSADDLSYFVRNRRANSVYGSSPVERALPLLDLYLRRQQWLRAEYTDGVTPEMMLTSDADFGNDPLVMKQYENIINDNLAGQTEQRKRALILPAGLTPQFYEGYGEKFKSALDEYLITSITGHFGVLPTEIGFSQKGGLGSSGHQAGEAMAAQSIGVAPLANWIGKMLTNISYTYLGMPRELEFQFMIEDAHDTEQEAKKSDLEVRGGAKTLNERRTELGLPLLDTPAADQPILVAGNGVYLFSPDGIVNASNPAGAAEEEIDPDTNPLPEVSAKPSVSDTQTSLKPLPNEDKPLPDTPKPTDDIVNTADFEKAGVPSKSEVKDALSRLAILPNEAAEHPTSDNPEKLAESVESPWPVVETAEGNYIVSPDVWEKAKLTLVNIKELYGTNYGMNRKNVADHIESMGQALTPYRGYPLVYNDGERNIIIDGHHRLFAMWLLGMDTAPVWLGTPDMAKAANDEMQRYLKWAKKGSANYRDFVFKTIDPIVAEALNRCAFDGDMDTAYSLAKAYLQ